MCFLIVAPRYKCAKDLKVRYMYLCVCVCRGLYVFMCILGTIRVRVYHQVLYVSVCIFGTVQVRVYIGYYTCS